MSKSRPWRMKPELPFLLFLSSALVAYLALLLALVAANVVSVSLTDLVAVLKDPAILRSIRLTFLTCTATAILSILIAVPIGYLMSRFRFPGRALIDTVLDIPILLPPLIVGLSLLILFNRMTPSALLLILGVVLSACCVVVLFFGKIKSLGLLGMGIAVILLWAGLAGMNRPGSIESFFSEKLGLPFTFQPLGVILAQLPVAAAFAIRMIRTTFDQISPRYEAVALTLGCNRGQAFSRVTLPLAGRGILAAGTMAWARALGEFGPVLVFAGATRGRTEVLSTSVFLEINTGNLAGAAAISLLMIFLAIVTLLAVRFFSQHSFHS